MASGNQPDPCGNDVPADAASRKRRFFQFTLGQFLLLFVVIAVLLGLLAPDIHREFRFWRLRQKGRSQEAADADFIEAVRTNNVGLARQALEAGADPNKILRGNQLLVGNQPSVSPLCACILSGQLEMMEVLLDHGADIKRAERVSIGRGPFLDGSPLFIACACDQPPEVRREMIRLLVEHGADPSPAVFGGLKAMDHAVRKGDAQTGDLLREFGVPYGPREMAAFNHLDELKQVIEDNPEIIKARFRVIYAGLGPTLLAIALERGYREMSLYLIDAGAPLDTVVYEGSTMLHQAAKGGDPEIIRLLIARGLDVNATDDYHYHDTPLSDVAGRAKPEAIAALLEAGSDVNHRGVNDQTPLWRAVHNKRIEIVRMLLAAGADPTIPDIKGRTPLDVARNSDPTIGPKGDPAIAELLEEAVRPK